MAVEVPENQILGEKRKRGRPRRNANPSLGRGGKNLVKGIFVNGNNRANVIKGILVNGNNVGEVERDRERVNGKGEEVDFGELAQLEDPYRGELERRSVGLRTEEEFLGFLGGLSGQWGSRRRKRRVVDAGEFGDALPRGWKLILSLKKKDGRVWVHVRRYISPSGRHFVSCKEVASYLLSVCGLEGVNQPSFELRNDNVQSTQEMADQQAADSVMKDFKESVKMECYSPSVVNYVPDQKQITSVMTNSGELEAENVLKCEKCNLSFNGKDDLMHHKLSSHRRRRSKFGSSITDGVIIKDGEYECQFCHKRFIERHRYNGHVGAHKRHHMTNDEGSPQVVLSLPSSVDLGSPCQVHPKESIVQASTGDDSDSVTANYGTDSQTKPASPHSALNIGSDKEVRTDQPYNEVNNILCDEQESQSITRAHSLAEQNCLKSDVDHKLISSLCSVVEANCSAAVFSTSTESEGPMAINETDTIGDLSAIKVDGCKPSPGAQDNTARADIIVSEVSVVDPCLQADSDIISLALKEKEISCNADSEEFPINLPLDRSKLDSEKSDSKVTPIHSSLPVSVNHNEDHIKSDDVDMVSSSALAEPKQKILSESTDEVFFCFKDIYEGCNRKTGTAHNSENKVKIGHDKSICCLNIPPQTDELGDEVDHGKTDFARTTDSSGQVKCSEISDASIAVGNIAHREPERPKIDKIPTYRSSENAFGISHQILRPEVRRPECGLPFLSSNQQFFTGENTSGFNSVLSQQKSTVDNGFQTEHCMGNSFSDVYTVNRVANSSPMEPKPDATLSSSNNELMIDFGNNGSGIVTNSMDNVPIEQIFFEIDRSRESCRTGEESKQESDLLGPSYYTKPGSSENYLDRNDTGSFWDGPILDGATGFGHDKLMIGFSNSGAQSHGDPMGANFWRTDERNTFQTNLAGPATQHEGSSTFLNANIIPDKDDDIFLGFNGVQSAATEHVEFSFMTPHNLDSFPRDSKTMYNSGMAPGFDSSFWYGKDDLSLNITARNMVTSICAWCRNEFRHEPEDSATQNGAIGSICPTCSARVSQQFNVF